MPARKFPYRLNQNLDEMSMKHENGTARATARRVRQVHRILKSDLKTVFSSITNAVGSCVGACDELSSNVVCTTAPIVLGLYQQARYGFKMVGKFLPLSQEPFLKYV